MRSRCGVWWTRVNRRKELRRLPCSTNLRFFSARFTLFYSKNGGRVGGGKIRSKLCFLAKLAPVIYLISACAPVLSKGAAGLIFWYRSTYWVEVNERGFFLRHFVSFFHLMPLFFVFFGEKWKDWICCQNIVPLPLWMGVIHSWVCACFFRARFCCRRVVIGDESGRFGSIFLMGRGGLSREGTKATSR